MTHIPRTLRQWEDYNRGAREGRILAYNGYGLGHYKAENLYWQAGKVCGYNEVLLAGLFNTLVAYIEAA